MNDETLTRPWVARLLTVVTVVSGAATFRAAGWRGLLLLVLGVAIGAVAVAIEWARAVGGTS